MSKRGQDAGSVACYARERARTQRRAAQRCLGVDLATTARVVGGLAQVAPEGGVDDDARVPRPGSAWSLVHRGLQAPRGAAPVELDELLRGEPPAQAPAQLGDQGFGDALQQRAALRRSGPQATLALLPLVD